MRSLFSLTIVAVSIFLPFCRAYAENPEAFDRRHVEEWLDKRRSEGLVVLTPPLGTWPPEVGAAKARLDEMIEDLVGPELRRRGIKLVVNILGSRHVNAFAGENRRDLPFSDESYFAHDHERIWPVRKLYGLKDGVPMYEVGVYIGLLQHVRNRDELAFVLAHEIAGHIFEEHTSIHNYLDNFYRWWSSQQLEAVADRRAIEVMAGKYNLDAALTFMDHLKDDRAQYQPDFFESSTKTHHHEGVRLALLQATIEETLRGNERAHVATKPVAPELRVPFEIPHKSRPGDAEVRAQLTRMLQRLIEDKRSWWLTDSRWDTFGKAFPESKSEIQIRVTELDLTLAVDDLESMTAPATIKAAAFFKYLTFVQNRRHPGDVEYMFRRLSDAGLERVRSFLADLAKDPAFAAKDVLRTFTAKDLAVFATMFDRAEVFMTFMMELFERAPRWLDLGPSIVRAFSHGFDGHKSLIFLSRLVDKGLAARERHAFHDFAFEHLLEFLSSAPQSQVDALIKSSGPIAGEFFEPWIDPRHPRGSFDEARITIFQRQSMRWREAFLGARTQRLKDFLRLSRMSTVESIYRVLGDPGVGRFSTKPAAEDLVPIRAALRKHLLGWFTQSLEHQIVHLERIRKISADGDYLEAIAAELNNPLATPEERRAIFEFLVRTQSVELAFPHVHGSNAVQALLMSELRKLSPANTFAILNAKDPRLSSKAQVHFARYVEIPREEIDLDTKVGLDRAFGKVSTLFLGEKAKRLNMTSSRHAEEGRRLFHAVDQWATHDLPLLALLGTDQAHARRIADGWSPEQIDTVLNLGLLTLRRLHLYHVVLRNKADLSEVQLGLRYQAGSFLLELVARQHEHAPTAFEIWRSKVHAVIAANPLALKHSADLAQRLRGHLDRFWPTLSREDIVAHLSDPTLFKIMGAEQWSTRAVDEIDRARAHRPLADVVREFAVATKFENDHPEAWLRFKRELVNRLRVQPRELAQVFPESRETITVRTSAFGVHLRALSGLVAETRRHPEIDQFEVIKYVLGASDRRPSWLIEMSDSHQTRVPLDEIVEEMRQRARDGSILERTLIANSFLAGRNGPIGTPEGEDRLLDDLLCDVRADVRPLARQIARATVRAQGERKSLAFSFVLAHVRARTDATALDEGVLLRAFILAHGVPGIKFGQYLAHTQPELRPLLAPLQDDTRSYEYFDAVMHLQRRFGDAWPEKFEVEEPLGTGSANAGIALFDRETGERKVVTSLYPDIVVATEEDYRRVERVLRELVETPEDAQRFGYLFGLLPLVRDSTRLEFDKRHGYEMQNRVASTYAQTRHGWTVRVVRAEDVTDHSTFMDLAPGITARRLLESDPETYASAMATVVAIEDEILDGFPRGASLRSRPLHANPDLHDGQVLVDMSTRTISILDFGQATLLSNAEREIAKGLMGLSVGVYSSRSAQRWLAKTFAPADRAAFAAKAAEILALPDPMNRFIRMVSLLREHRARVPISIVHWVLAKDRIQHLSHRLDLNLERKTKRMLMVQRFGLPATAHAICERLMGE